MLTYTLKDNPRQFIAMTSLHKEFETLLPHSYSVRGAIGTHTQMSTLTSTDRSEFGKLIA